MLKEREKELKLLGLALKSSDSSRLKRRHYREKSTFSMTVHKPPPTASSSHLPHHRALARHTHSESRNHSCNLTSNSTMQKDSKHS